MLHKPLVKGDEYQKKEKDNFDDLKNHFKD